MMTFYLTHLLKLLPKIILTVGSLFASIAIAGPKLTLVDSNSSYFQCQTLQECLKYCGRFEKFNQEKRREFFDLHPNDAYPYPGFKGSVNLDFIDTNDFLRFFSDQSCQNNIDSIKIESEDDLSASYRLLTRFSLTRLNLSNSPLSSMGNGHQTLLLIEYLRLNRTLTHLNLSNTRIKKEEASELFSALESGPALVELSYDNNSLSGVNSFFNYLKNNRSLVMLSIKATQLGPAEAPNLIDSLRSNETIKELNLDFNGLKTDSIQAISALHQQRPYTTLHIDFQYNHLRAPNYGSFNPAPTDSSDLKTSEISESPPQSAKTSESPPQSAKSSESPPQSAKNSDEFEFLKIDHGSFEFAKATGFYEEFNSVETRPILTFSISEPISSSTSSAGSSSPTGSADLKKTGFALYKAPGDGDCGYHVLGIRRSQVVNRLINLLVDAPNSKNAALTRAHVSGLIRQNGSFLSNLDSPDLKDFTVDDIARYLATVMYQDNEYLDPTTIDLISNIYGLNYRIFVKEQPKPLFEAKNNPSSHQYINILMALPSNLVSLSDKELSLRESLESHHWTLLHYDLLVENDDLKGREKAAGSEKYWTRLFSGEFDSYKEPLTLRYTQAVPLKPLRLKSSATSVSSLKDLFKPPETSSSSSSSSKKVGLSNPGPSDPLSPNENGKEEKSVFLLRQMKKQSDDLELELEMLLNDDSLSEKTKHSEYERILNSLDSLYSKIKQASDE